MRSALSTILGAVILVAMAIGLFSTRAYYIHQRQEMGQRMRGYVPAITQYAQTHGHGVAPASTAAITDLIGKVPSRGYYSMNPQPCKWQAGTRAPYLWESSPHPFVGGVYVLYSDGTVLLEDVPPLTGHTL